MKTEQILLALNIAREKSISKAAESLFLSQPTASNMLKSLEKELGFPIFHRTRTGILLTEKGSEFITYAESIERALLSIARIRQPERRFSFIVLSPKFEFTELAFEQLCRACCSGGCSMDLSYQTVSNTEDAARMAESGQGDVAIAVCRKSLYETCMQSASKKQLATALVCESRLELTCRRAHPILRNGTIETELLGKYPCFTGIHPSSLEQYAPYYLAGHGKAFGNFISMDPCPARFRLLHQTNGYLVSMPVPDEVKAAYDLESAVIEDSDVAVFAMFRNDPQKEKLIQEYIQLCRSFC